MAVGIDSEQHVETKTPRDSTRRLTPPMWRSAATSAGARPSRRLVLLAPRGAAPAVFAIRWRLRHPEVEFEVPEVDEPEQFEPELPRIGQKKRLALPKTRRRRSSTRPRPAVTPEAEAFPPEAPGVDVGSALCAAHEAATEARPTSCRRPFAAAPPTTANTRAAAAELIHNVGWPVPPGLFLDAWFAPW